MKEIVIHHFHGELKELRNTYAEHKATIKDITLKNTILNLILDKGYNAMLIQEKERLIIYVDSGRFRQR